MSYANFPPTEYLDLDFLDFVSFNVYLHRERDFRRYLSRLQNLADDKPLVLTEFGIDSMREGARRAGADPVLAGARRVRVGRRRHRRSSPGPTTGSPAASRSRTGPSAWSIASATRSPRSMRCSALPRRAAAAARPTPPKISVVICAYNAERTMDACLASLRALRYPNYEVIVVNDGSTDRTLEIAQRYPEVRIISQENKGLSVARNVGIEAATGEIVAYTDSDCVVDPDWLTYLAYKFVHGGFVAVGGPNLPPPEESRTAACVAASPGGPTHVLLNDEVAEHIPGCNMAFRKDVAGGDRRLRSDLPRRRRRRRSVLAPAERRARHRLQPGGDGLALPPQHDARPT